MYYDGLGCDAKPEEGVACLIKVATSKHRLARHLVHASQYNTGTAYYQGYGVPQQSNNEAERWWLLAADDGNPKGSVKAQTALGMFYSSDGCLDLEKAFYWHSEACGNGSLESQGALGVMYEHKIGGRSDTDSAYICLKEASDRGNVYAMGNLIAHYYRRKLYTKAADLTSKVSQYSDIQQIAKETDCLPTFIAKGISMACFYYARCLAEGHGMDKDKEEAKKYYSKSYQFDPDVCAQLQNITNHGVI